MFDFTNKNQIKIKPKIIKSNFRSSSREKISYWLPMERNLNNNDSCGIININAYHEPENINFEKSDFANFKKEKDEIDHISKKRYQTKNVKAYNKCEPYSI